MWDDAACGVGLVGRGRSIPRNSWDRIWEADVLSSSATSSGQDSVPSRRREGTPVPPLFLLAHEGLRSPATMRRKAVPDYQQLSRDIVQQMAEKHHLLRAADGPGIQMEVEVPLGHPGHGRQQHPVEVILQPRRLAFRRPALTAMRLLAQSSLVHKDDGLPLLLGFYLSSGQRCVFQRRMAASSRSSARPAGHRQLQPRRRSRRQTYAGWYVTPHSRALNSATRPAVHRLVEYPSASSPC